MAQIGWNMNIQITTDYAAWVAPPPAAVEIIQPRYLLSKDIIQQTAKDHGVPVSQMLSRSRCRRYAYARFDAMTRLRAVKHRGQPRYSLPQIGKMMDRDHTSVLSGLRRWAKVQAELAAKRA